MKNKGDYPEPERNYADQLGMIDNTFWRYFEGNVW